MSSQMSIKSIINEKDQITLNQAFNKKLTSGTRINIVCKQAAACS
ncbi:hypothetical protein NMY3_00532 [Candidatus Nitrosocosmicus oleophilus]|jgi:hypothetical protein|uniref:Uncharacterized protein n=1 Tax=Candidatus Nitrosocosmicus oleophilus TaxID=1353260 RepID=A0A654LTN9_9ARCH|nr:hypothetical protein NMY3_00532 [Candidatus Nitrosocosmicus oleophilus]